MFEKMNYWNDKGLIWELMQNNPSFQQIGKKDGARKAIFMDCGIHAREWVSPAFCQWFVYQASKPFTINLWLVSNTLLNDNISFQKSGAPPN